jgi:hypothetical protein
MQHMHKIATSVYSLSLSHHLPHRAGALLYKLRAKTLALSPVGLYSGLTDNGLALVPLALSPVGLYSGFAKNGLALIPLALSPVGLYSGLTDN